MKICPCCMEEHDMHTITVIENNVFKNIPVEYEAKYYYCSSADETYADEQQISTNDIAMKNAYRALPMGAIPVAYESIILSPMEYTKKNAHKSMKKRMF